jgi:hypothetical protein
MNRSDLIRDIAFEKGLWEVRAIARDGARPLLQFTLALTEEDDSRRPPELHWVPNVAPVDLERVVDALVRAGVRHRGLKDEDLRILHYAAAHGGHIELFADLNALKNGLVQYVVRSLGRSVGRVVVSSSSIDVLHEYQALARRQDDGSRKYLASWEMGRALQVLDELRQDVPVHVHQLPVGAARYVRRVKAEPTITGTGDGDEQEDPQLTFISEDRQMVGAYWDYATSTNPRLPLHLITSDFALAHVCSAERVPFLFARAPREVWRGDMVGRPKLETLWFDPFAMALRTCLTHQILWELCLVFGQLNVVPIASTGAGFSLTYDPRDQAPGREPDLRRGPLLIEKAATPPPSKSGSPGLSKPKKPGGGKGPAKPKKSVDIADTDSGKGPSKLRVSLQSLVEILPTHVNQRIPFAQFQPKDEDTRRQLRQIGEQTGLFTVKQDEVVAGPSLGELLSSLQNTDYVNVNRIFEQQPAYHDVLEQVRQGNPFPSSKQGGTATGWAVILGAAYKSTAGVRSGLATVTEEQFERAVERAHRELGGGQPAVTLADILDRTCIALDISPIRFETLLNQCIGQRGLRGYEAQRASVQGSIPPHPLLVSPKTSSPKNYIELFEPARGLRVGGKLVQSLVLRPGAG